MPKILYFESAPFISDMYKRKLEQAGLEVKHFKDTPADPVSLVLEEKPDLIITDIMMPKGMDGFEMTKLLKKNDQIKDIPIVCCTNFGTKEYVEKGLELGMVDYLIMANFMPDELVEKVKSILKSLNK